MKLLNKLFKRLEFWLFPPEETKVYATKYGEAMSKCDGFYRSFF